VTSQAAGTSPAGAMSVTRPMPPAAAGWLLALVVLRWVA
jgi:hypothetical protein